MLAYDIVYGAMTVRHVITLHDTVDDSNEHVAASSAVASDMVMPFEVSKNHARVRTEKVPEERADLESGHPSFAHSERSCSTTKDCRINLRLSAIQLHDIALRAELERLPTATYVRDLIQRDIARDHDVVIRRLARMIIYSSVALQILHPLISLEGEVHTVERKTLRILNEMEMSFDFRIST